MAADVGGMWGGSGGWLDIVRVMERTGTEQSSGAGPREPDFVVFASPKSGTTWMQMMLNAHPEAHCIESRAWGMEHRAFANGRFHVNVDKYAAFVGGLAHLGGGEEDLARRMHGALLDWAAARSGKRVVGEKSTPYPGTSGYALGRYASARERAVFVHLVRDPRDVVVSMFVHHSWAHPAQDPEKRARIEEMVRARRVPQSAIDRALENWLDVERAWAGREERRESDLEVRYEDLVARPGAEFARVCEAVGIDSSEAVVERCVGATTFEALSGRARGEEDLRSFFRKGEAGDWVNWLTAEQSDAICAAAGALMVDTSGALTGKSGR